MHKATCTNILERVGSISMESVLFTVLMLLKSTLIFGLHVGLSRKVKRVNLAHG